MKLECLSCQTVSQKDLELAQLRETMKRKDQKIKELDHEGETMLLATEFLLASIEVWAKAAGMIPSAGDTEDEARKELTNGKEKVRTLFNKLVEMGEPAFLNGLLGALHLPQDFQHLL